MVASTSPSPAPFLEAAGEAADVECECPGPPPEFRLPPPPRPPFLQDPDDCSENALADYETCAAVPVIDAEFHSSPALPSAVVIAVCSVVLLVMVLLVSVLVWKHKRKMQNFLPCKSSPQNRCDVSGGNGVIYEDLTNIHPRAMPLNHCPPGHPAPPIEMTDVPPPQYGAGYPPQLMGGASVFICPPPRAPIPRPGQEDLYQQHVDLYNPVYEELSNGSEGSRESEEGPCRPSSGGHHGEPRACSEDEFAEDELSLAGDIAPRAPTPPPANTLPSRRHHHPHHEAPTSGTSSLQGSTGNDLCRDLDSSDADDRHRQSETDSFLAMRMNMNNRNNMSLPPGRRSREPPPPPPGHPRTSERRPKSLDRRRGWRNSPRTRSHKPPSPPPAGLEPAAFHEGLLMDALHGGFPRGLMFPGGRRQQQQQQQRSPPQPAYHLPYQQTPYVVSNRSVNPYESVSVLGLEPPRRPELTSFRPPPKTSSSQDSFNSDSGFSNHTTSGGRATSGGGSTRGRHGELYDSMRPLPPLLS